MITIISTNQEARPKEIYGLSTDTKPTNVPNASIFYEMDTRDLYLFDRENLRWLAQKSK